MASKVGCRGTWVSEGIPSDPSLFSDNSLSDRLASTTFADVRDRDDLNNFVDSVDPDFIFHLAAQPIVSQSILDPTRTIETNVLGVSNIFDCVRIRRKPCSLVVITSDKCYENLEWVWGYRENDRMGGKDPYSASKGAAELIFSSFARTFKDEYLKYGVSIASARAGNVIGGGDWAVDRIVPDVYRKWSAGKVAHIQRQMQQGPGSMF